MYIHSTKKMIFLKKNSVNNFYLTVREESSYSGLALSAGSPNYLFNFRNDMTFQDLYFIPALVSATSRADQFRILETGSTYVNLTGGTINLRPQIYYHYYVYENLTPYNLDLSGTTGVCLEQGKLFLSGSPEVSLVYYSGRATPNYFYSNLT